MAVSRRTASAEPPTPPRRSREGAALAPRATSVSASRTVRSAPVSTRNTVRTQDPSVVFTSPGTTGRTTPSSHGYHSSSMSVDARHLYNWNVTYEDPVVFWVPPPRLFNSPLGSLPHK